MQLTQHISKITYKSPNETNIKRKERIEGMNINLFINQTVGRHNWQPGRDCRS